MPLHLLHAQNSFVHSMRFIKSSLVCTVHVCVYFFSCSLVFILEHWISTHKHTKRENHAFQWKFVCQRDSSTYNNPSQAVSLVFMLSLFGNHNDAVIFFSLVASTNDKQRVLKVNGEKSTTTKKAVTQFILLILTFDHLCSLHMLVKMQNSFGKIERIANTHDKPGQGDTEIEWKWESFWELYTLALLSSWSHFCPLHYFIQCFMKQSVSVSRNSQVIKWGKFYQTNVSCHGKCLNLLRCTHDTGNIALEKWNMHSEQLHLVISFSLSHTHLHKHSHEHEFTNFMAYSIHSNLPYMVNTISRYDFIGIFRRARAFSWNKHDGTRNLFAFHIYILKLHVHLLFNGRTSILS